MRHDNGMKFENCIGLEGKDEGGKIFVANVLDCHDKPLNTGESILVSGRPYLYRGDDNLGNSIFVPLEPFPEPERIEQPYKDFFIALEIYTMKNGHFYVWPYVQRGETSSGSFARQHFQFKGEFETREAAVAAAVVAGKEQIDELCCPSY